MNFCKGEPGDSVPCSSKGWAEKEGLLRRACKSSAFLRQIGNLIFVDEQVRLSLSSKPQHIAIVILNPAPQSFSVHQLQRDRGLLLRQLLQIRCFFVRALGRRSFLLLPLVRKWHDWILPREADSWGYSVS